MDNRKVDLIKNEVHRIQLIAEYLVKATNNLNELLEDLNPANPVKKSKAPTREELTQIELQKLISKKRR